MANQIASSRNVPLGNQLARKVNSGQLSRGQATKVKNQRSMLAKAFGPEWRVKVYGNKEGAKGIGGPFARGQVAAKRSTALERAKTKLATGAPAVTLKNGGTQAPWKERQNRSNGGTTAP
jgi:hypothetical protein